MHLLNTLKDLERLAILIHQQLQEHDLNSAQNSSKTFNKESRRLEYRKKGLKKLPEMDEVKHLKALVTSARYDNQKVEELIAFFVKLQQGQISRGEATINKGKRELLTPGTPAEFGRFQKNYEHMVDLSLLTIEAIKQSIAAFNEEPWYNPELLRQGKDIHLVEDIFHKRGFYRGVDAKLLSKILGMVEWKGITIKNLNIPTINGEIIGCTFTNVSFGDNGVTFKNCTFTNCRLETFSNIYFENCNLSKCYIKHGNQGHYTKNCKLNECELVGAFSLVDSTINSCKVVNSHLGTSEATFNNCSMREVYIGKFTSSERSSIFEKCIIEGSLLTEACSNVFSRCNFPGTTFGVIQFQIWDGFDRDKFHGCDFKDAIYGRIKIPPRDLVTLKNWHLIKGVPKAILARLDLKDLAKYATANKMSGGDLSLVDEGSKGGLSLADEGGKLSLTPKPQKIPKKPRKGLWKRLRGK